jgi:hypothetical protein
MQFRISNVCIFTLWECALFYFLCVWWVRILLLILEIRFCLYYCPAEKCFADMKKLSRLSFDTADEGRFISISDDTWLFWTPFYFVRPHAVMVQRMFLAEGETDENNLFLIFRKAGQGAFKNAFCCSLYTIPTERPPLVGEVDPVPDPPLFCSARESNPGPLRL